MAGAQVLIAPRLQIPSPNFPMPAECGGVAGEIGGKGYMIEMSQSIRAEDGHPTPGKLAELGGQHALGSSLA